MLANTIFFAFTANSEILYTYVLKIVPAQKYKPRFELELKIFLKNLTFFIIFNI